MLLIYNYLRDFNSDGADFKTFGINILLIRI